jgi:hypothetical protein
VRREARVAEHRPGGVPRLAEVDLNLDAKYELHQVAEIPGYLAVGHVIAFALHNIRGEPRRRLVGQVVWEESDVPHEDATDFRIVIGADRLPAVMRDALPHPLQAGGAIRLAEHLPCLRRAQRGEPAEESAANDTVMRSVRLEEERLTHGQRTEFTATARPNATGLRPKCIAAVLIFVTLGDCRWLVACCGSFARG